LATSAQIQMFERRLVIIISVAAFLVILAAFAGVLFARRNTLAIVDPLVRWFWLSASTADISRIHDMVRKFGHFPDSWGGLHTARHRTLAQATTNRAGALRLIRLNR